MKNKGFNVMWQLSSRHVIAIRNLSCQNADMQPISDAKKTLRSARANS